MTIMMMMKKKMMKKKRAVPTGHGSLLDDGLNETGAAMNSLCLSISVDNVGFNSAIGVGEFSISYAVALVICVE